MQHQRCYSLTCLFCIVLLLVAELYARTDMHSAVITTSGGMAQKG